MQSSTIYTTITNVLDPELPNDNLIHDLQAYRERIIKTNKEEYYQHHPDHVEVKELLNPLPVDQVDLINNVNTAIQTTALIKKFDIKELSSRWSIFLAIVDHDAK